MSASSSNRPGISGSAASSESVEQRLRAALTKALQPLRLVVINESHLHAGHRSSPGTGDSHFRVSVVSERFQGLSRVARHRLVNEAVSSLIGNPIHALALETRSPDEASPDEAALAG